MVKLSKKIIVSCVLVALIILGLYGKGRLERGVSEIVGRDLKRSLNSNAEGVKQWLIEKKESAKELSLLPDIASQAYRLQKYQSEERGDTLARKSLKATLETDISRLSSRRFDDFYIVDKSGKIIASKTSISGKAQLQDLSVFLQSMNESFGESSTRTVETVSKSGKKGLSIQIVTALSQELDKAQLFLVFQIEMREKLSQILLNTRSGESGESYIINSDGMMICGSHIKAPSTNIATASMKSHMYSAHDHTLTEVAEMAFSQKDFIYPGVGTNLVGYHNYAGVNTIGAWTYIKEYNFAIITEIAYEEAFSPLKPFRQLFWSFFVLALLLSFVLIFSAIINLYMKEKIRLTLNEIDELGQYRLVRKIGEGTHGVVYKAEHKFMQRQTAIKLLKPEACTDEMKKRFLEEIKHNCRLTHANTIRIYDYGQTKDGYLYYVMEFLEGIDLDQLVRLRGLLSPERVIYLLKQVCASLKEAHAEGLIHRDIKPQNIFICKQGGDNDVVKVLDFGLVSQVDHPDGEVSGTPHFMSPEAILTPADIDHRTDLYALGVMGYFMLTGKYPFDRNERSVRKLLKTQVEQMPVKPSSIINHDIPIDLEQIILSCLEKDRENRPNNAEELIALLNNCEGATGWDSKKANDWWKSSRLNTKREWQGAKEYEKTVVIKV